jgi:hypothetical protein
VTGDVHCAVVVAGDDPVDAVCYWAKCSCGWSSDWTYLIEEAQGDKLEHEAAA